MLPLPRHSFGRGFPGAPVRFFGILSACLLTLRVYQSYPSNLRTTRSFPRVVKPRSIQHRSLVEMANIQDPNRPVGPSAEAHGGSRGPRAGNHMARRTLRNRDSVIDRTDFIRAQQIIQRMAPVEFYAYGKALEHDWPSARQEDSDAIPPIDVLDSSRPSSVSYDIIKSLHDPHRRAILHARGIQAINQAVKSIAVARREWGESKEQTENELASYVRMHPSEELTWACTLEVVPFTPQPEPPLQLGEIIEYNSSTHGVWIPGEVMNLNEDGTVDLNIREQADPSRIRRLIEELRVARTSEPDLVAKTILNKLKHGQPLMLAAIGASSVHAAVLGIALGSLYLQEEYEMADISFRPEFSTVELGSNASNKLVTLRLLLAADNLHKPNSDVSGDGDTTVSTAEDE